jgi:hypothetical protein
VLAIMKKMYGLAGANTVANCSPEVLWFEELYEKFLNIVTYLQNLLHGCFIFGTIVPCINVSFVSNINSVWQLSRSHRLNTLIKFKVKLLRMYYR